MGWVMARRLRYERETLYIDKDLVHPLTFERTIRRNNYTLRVSQITRGVYNLPRSLTFRVKDVSLKLNRVKQPFLL